MRIWDIQPGYLNRQSLLGEHRELHGIVSIISNKKKGYSRHPETLRWYGHGWALKIRHQQLVAEMNLRGYKDKSPVFTRSGKGTWPESYIDEPYQQFNILREKYQSKEQGRIPLPKTAQECWRHHKYSILARDPSLYKIIGSEVANVRPGDDFAPLAMRLTEGLRHPPSVGGIKNALQHMWGYVSEQRHGADVETLSLKRLIREIQDRSVANHCTYLLESTALSELAIWM